MGKLLLMQLASLKAIPKFPHPKFPNMIKNYLKIAWRNIRKHKSYTFINLFGLTTGLACFLFIALYLFDELTYDAFHKDASHIYRLVEQRTSATGKETKVASVAYNIGGRIKTALPGTTEACRITWFGRVNINNYENSKVFYEDYTVANGSF